MGKNNRHKKFLKSEKAKVKLKGSKKLTKGQNITDTSFKTKKIVLLSQLSQTPEDQPQTKRKLNLKELLMRTKHYNANMKQDALSGLRELAVLHPDVLSTNLCSYIESSAALCIDLEASVRQESLRLLNHILDQVSTVQLEPFMPLLVSYLSVGMSHLHQDVQSDALRMLDIVLATAPTLVAKAASKLLPAFLDQISVRRNTASGERNLSLNLQSSNTSTRWRIKVLGRLHAMLCAVVTTRTSLLSEDNTQKQVFWSPEITTYAPVKLWSWDLDTACEIQGLFTTGNDSFTNQSLFQNQDEMKKYISVLMPLLFDTWIEVGPSQKQEREIGSLISSEAAELLQCVLEIVQNIWVYLERTDRQNGNNLLRSWFQSNYRSNFVSHVVTHFPYCTAAEESSKASKKRRTKGQAPFEEERLRSCTSQNLAVCHVFCCLCVKPKREQAQAMLAYTKKCMDAGQHVSQQLLHVLQCMLSSCEWGHLGVDTAPLADSAINCCLNKHSCTSPLFSLLCDVALESIVSNSNRAVADTTYYKFLEELPRALKESTCSLKALQTITQLAAMQNSVMLLGVKLYLPQILGKLGEIQVEGMDQRTVQTNIVGIVLRTSLWRFDILDYVARQMSSIGVDKSLTDYYKDLLLFESEMNPSSPLNQKIKTMSWFFSQ